jgi:hypothetical protein
LAGMATISGIQAKVSTAVQQLIKADQDDPNVLLTPDQIRANPYQLPKGNDGKVDGNEVKTVSDPFARSVFQATQLRAGQNIEEGGFGTGFKDTVMPEWEVSYGDLHALQTDVNLIVSKLQTDKDGNVTPEALAKLPQTVAEYFKDRYAGNESGIPRQITQDHIAEVIREAATGVVEWH